jgi:ATP-dependent Clp protease ATP-binding subunit ClpC
MNGYHPTEQVRKILLTAQEESVRLHHEYVGTEHLLLGLLREGEGVAAAVLQNLDVDLDALMETINTTVGPGRVTATGLDRPFTSRAEKVLELAMATARDFNHSYVGSEHLLIGLLREEKGIAAQLLTRAGATLDVVRAWTLHLIGTDSPPGRVTDAATASPVVEVSVRMRRANGTDSEETFRTVLAAIGFLRRQS